MDNHTRHAEPRGPRRDFLGWVERKFQQFLSISLLAAGMVLVAVGTYVLFHLLMSVFGVLDKLLQIIGRSLP